jgi:hypothetical protein
MCSAEEEPGGEAADNKLHFDWIAPLEFTDTYARDWAVAHPYIYNVSAVTQT